MRILFVTLSFLAMHSAVSGAPTPQVSADAFAALPFLNSPTLSSDGHRIAAEAVSNGNTTVVILDADHPGKILKSLPLGDKELSSVHWAGSNRLLLTVWSSGQFAGIELPFLRLIGVDIDSGNARILDPKSRGLYAGDILYTSPDGDWALVASQNDISTYPSVKRVDLATGTAVEVEKPRDKVWDWYADENGVVRAGVAVEGKRWTLWYRDAAGEKLKKLRGKIEEDKDSAVDKFIFRGNQSWIVTNDRTGRFGLYKFNLGDGEIGEKIFEHPTVDLTDVLYDPSSGEVLAIEFEEDRRRVKWLDPEWQKLQVKLDSALPGTVNLPVEMSDDEQRVLIASTGASDPGRYFMLDRKSGKMHAIIDPFPSIDPGQLATTEWVEYRARDGLSVHAYLTVPKGRSAQNLPLVVMPHGGPYDRDHWEYDPLVQLLANRGYAVLQPQFRGSTGFGRDFVAKGYGEWGLAMQNDLDDGLAWLASSGKIDPKRVCIVGASYGGYAAMWAAIRNSGRYRCAVSFAGISDLSRQVSANKKMFSATRYFKEWRAKVDGSGARKLDEVSPLKFAAQVNIPLLIGHGEKDSIVSSKQSRWMVEALEKNGKTVESVFYPSAAHGFTRVQDRADWFRRIEAFLRRHNPA